jgi:drug/metabolite transporter (DMT)-like permease
MSSLPPAGFGLSTSLAWGTSNFLDGFASQRGNPFLLATISNFSALSFLLALAAVLRAPGLSVHGQIWSLLAGTAGGCALAILYGALSSGHMGMASPVVAVLSVGIPATVTIVRVGSPGLPRLLGFALAILGVSLIGKTKDKTEKKVLGMALLAGCGFAAYSLAIKQVGPGSAILIELNSRLAAFFMTAVVTLGRRKFRDFQVSPSLWATTAGWLDVAGSIAFIRASQTGRLDTAVVLASLYPAVTVSLAVVLLKERLTISKAVGVCAALAALSLIVG